MDEATNPTENRTSVVVEAIAAAKKAEEMRGAAIKELLAQREQIERDLKTLGYVASVNGHNGVQAQARALPAARRFRDMNLAPVAKVLIAESSTGELHGKEIETLAHAGGFTRGTQNFQNYLPVALKRAGGFENVGGNRWRLNESVEPQRQ